MLVLRRFLLFAVLLMLGTTVPAVASAQTPSPTPSPVDRTPGIQTVSPSHGPAAGGYQVRVGTRSSSGTVLFGGKPVQLVSTAVGDDFVNGIAYYYYTVVVPPGTPGTTVDVTVGGVGGVTPSANDFTYDGAAPTSEIRSLIYGNYGGATTGGNLVAVLVSGEIDPSAVLSLGDRAATDTVVSPNNVFCLPTAPSCPDRPDGWIVWATAPAGEAGRVEVTVRTEGATIRGAGDGIFYQYVAAPTIDSVTPASGPLAGGGTVDILIRGDWFTAGPDVTIGGVPATVLSYGGADGDNDPLTSLQRIRVTVPPGTQPGTVDVRVRGRGRVWGMQPQTDVTHTATGATEQSDDYTYEAPTPPPPPAPVIAGHTGGPGYANIGGLLIVRGSNLGGLRSIKVGGRAALRLSATPTMIVAFAPPLAKGAYPVTVTTTAGTATAPVKYVYRSLF